MEKFTDSRTEWKIRSSSEDTSFKISIIHSNGDIKEEVRYWGMEFRKTVWTEYTSLGIFKI